MREKKNLLNYCGLLGIAAILSYTAVGYGCFPLSDSVFAATGFNAVLGVQLFRMKLAEQDCTVFS